MIHLTLPYGLARDITFHLHPGECLLLAGPNGCGKTTLLRALASQIHGHPRLLEVSADTGSGRAGEGMASQIHGHPRLLEVSVDAGSGRAGEGMASQIHGHPRLLEVSADAGSGRAGEGMASQIHGHPRPCKGEGPAAESGGRGREATICEAIPSPARYTFIPTGIPKVKGFTVEEFVRTGCYRESNWAGKLSAEAEKRMGDALELLRLTDKRRQDISTLSDGEFQKACIAVGLTLHTDVLLLDEPTAFLDVENRLMVLQTIRQVAEETGTAVIFSSHDLHDALRAAHRVLAFTPDGRFLESTTDNRQEVLHAAFPTALFLL